MDRIHDENDMDKGKQAIAQRLNLQRLKSSSADVIMFFDDTNPLMQRILHLDYFEYEKIKS